MSLVVLFLPVAVYLTLVYMLDRFSLVKPKDLAMYVGIGMVAALLCSSLFYLFSGRFVYENPPSALIPALEEFVKALPLVAAARRRKIAFFIDSVICGTAVGAGYSLLNNMFYLLYYPDVDFSIALFRGFEVSLVHVGCSAIVASTIMLSERRKQRRQAQLGKVKADMAVAMILRICAIGLRMLHRSIHVDPLIQTIGAVSLMALLLLFTYRYDTHQIRRWIDRGLNRQLELLNAIRQGQLGETSAGRYLLTVKTSFLPEVFSDVICYVQLHTELSIAAKSRFMAHEMGVDYPLSQGRKKELLAKYEEYKSLGKALDKSALFTIGPLLKFYPADRKALNDLVAACRAV